MRKEINKFNIFKRIIGNSYLIITIFLLMIIITNNKLFADGEFNRDVSITDVDLVIGGKVLNGFYSDPVVYYEDASSGYLNDFNIQYKDILASDKIIYTAKYPKTTTNRLNSIEYTCESIENEYQITKINTTGDGSTYIPVNGFVISLPMNTSDSFSINDKVIIPSKLIIPTKAVESKNGYRIVVDSTNTTRSKPMVVYYDYQFGDKTGTNIYGTEMTCVYDFDKATFVVKSFRGFGMGDASGSDIPDNSFVLSSYGEGYRQLLVEGQLFNKDEEVQMVGFDFIRFGGTVNGEFDFINPTKEMNPKGMETESTPFDAFRGENQTIIYKDGWSYLGKTGTGTNVYGFEAAVSKEGVVVELNVNVTKIPEGGYVISGHGTGRDYIRSNFVLGATVVLFEDLHKYSVTTTLNSYYENLVLKVESAKSLASQRIRLLYDVDKATLENYIQEAAEELNKLKVVKEQIETKIQDPSFTKEEKLSALMEYNKSQLTVEKFERLIIANSSESKVVSARGVWHRPYETTRDELEANISMYKSIGINMIFLETLYNGYSCFVGNTTFPYNKTLATNYGVNPTDNCDYLTAFLEIAKSKEIEVHAWVENFYVGTVNTIDVIVNHPDWMLYNKDSTYIQANEGGSYIFLDPANTEVQDILIKYYQDLFKLFPDLAGLNLDYIRYPVSDMDMDTGWTIAAMEEFGNKKGLTFSETMKNDRKKMANKFKQLFDINYLQNGEKEALANYNEWVEYRTSIITKFVKRIYLEVKKGNKNQNIILSTAVFPSIIDSKEKKKQDWKTWFTNGWIDIATPMAYYNDASDVLLNVNNMILASANYCYYYSGLASSYIGLPAYKNTEQIDASYMAKATGYVIFCSTQIIGHQDVQTVLCSGVNSKDGTLPHDDISNVLKAYFDDILDKSNRIYISNGGMDANKLDLLTSEFTRLQSLPTDSTVNLYKLKNEVSKVISSINKYALGYSSQRITEELKELNSIINTKMMQSLIYSGVWNPEENPLLPTITETGVIINLPKDDEDYNPIIDPPIITPEPPKDNKPIIWISAILGGICILAVITIFVFRKSQKIKNEEK